LHTVHVRQKGKGERLLHQFGGDRITRALHVGQPEADRIAAALSRPVGSSRLSFLAILSFFLPGNQKMCQ